ncbi:hypothetical protein RRF57_009555 [Xylaria bambusicola]|uniref:Uncharacterized protein n=1 Tax=Xylaria bambusicola TaxID=326684 RepID=A0AAN7UVS3_9PEZI
MVTNYRENNCRSFAWSKPNLIKGPGALAVGQVVRDVPECRDEKMSVSRWIVSSKSDRCEELKSLAGQQTAVVQVSRSLERNYWNGEQSDG